MDHKHPRLQRQSAGFSLIELMVALTIGLILIAGLMTLVVGNMQGYGELNKASYQLENARYASQFLRNELSMAGYYGNLTFPREAPDFPDDPCSTDKADVAARYDIFIQGWDSVASTDDEFACNDSISVKEGTDVLLLRRVSSSETELTKRNDDLLYFASNAKEFAILEGTESTSGIGFLSETLFRNVRQLLERVVYVSTCNVCSGDEADSIPTLKMIEIRNGDWSDPLPLVEGVDDLQVDYGLDEDENSTPERWVALPADRDEWAQVAAVRFHVLVRNVDDTAGFSDQKVYVMGLADEDTEQLAGPFEDGFKRHVYSMTVRLRNVTERLEE